MCRDMDICKKNFLLQKILLFINATTGLFAKVSRAQL